MGPGMSLVLILLLTLRTLDEEELLVNELDGYVAYPEKVKHRLLPFVW
jgi:protein-S-isoprenylcysteine O-methyltransferase Ste14